MRLIEVLPDYYDDNKTMQELQTIISQESDGLEEGLANTLKQIYWELSPMKENLIDIAEKRFRQRRRELRPRWYRWSSILPRAIPMQRWRFRKIMQDIQ